MTFGAQTGFAVNPARDLGPRILTAMVGYGREVFDFRQWVPFLSWSYQNVGKRSTNAKISALFDK